MANYISEVKRIVGEEIVLKIIEEAEGGSISTKQGEKLALELGEKRTESDRELLEEETQ